MIVLTLETLSLIVIQGTLCGIVFLTISAFLSTSIRKRRGNLRSLSGPSLYEDEDGKATYSSMAKFSDKLPKISANVSAVFGLLIALITTTRLALKFHNDEEFFLATVLRLEAWVCSPEPIMVALAD